MIFTSHEAADRWAKRHISSRMIFVNNMEEWLQSAVMCDGDVMKPERMRKYAREALDALDKLDAECDAAYCREETDLALDINCAMADVQDIVARLEASR